MLIPGLKLLRIIKWAKLQAERNPLVGDADCMTKGIAKVPVEHIERLIFFVRGEKVMLDSDLAKLYGVTTKALNQAVSRNKDRFPTDFMFRLTAVEHGSLNRSQIVTGLQKHRDPRLHPFAFTEQGVAMLSGVLRSTRAVKVNIEIMRAFVKFRRMLISNTELARKLAELESKYDLQFKVVFDAIRQLMLIEPSAKKPIGFRASPKS